MSSQADKALRRAAAPAGAWTVEGATSTARFAIKDKIVHTVRGTLPVTAGDVVTDAAGEVVSARVELDPAGIMTGNARRDRDVQGHRFLDSASHPRIVVEALGTTANDTGWTVDARLSARGASCPVELEVTPTSIEDGRVRMRVTGRLDRTGLGMRVPTFVIGRDLELDVDLHLVRS